MRTDRARGHAIDYHHLIGTLRRKPQALRYLVYREALFPRAAYARAWTALDEALAAKGRLPDHGRDCSFWRRPAKPARSLWPPVSTPILDAGRLPDLAELELEFASQNRPVSRRRHPRAKPRRSTTGFCPPLCEGQLS